jgi:hypothetical protein
MLVVGLMRPSREYLWRESSQCFFDALLSLYCCQVSMCLMSLWLKWTNFFLRVPTSQQLLNVGRCIVRTCEVATPNARGLLVTDSRSCCPCYMRSWSQASVKSAWRIINHLYREKGGGVLSQPVLFFFPLESERWRIRFLTSLVFIHHLSSLPLPVFHRNFSLNPKRQEPVSQAISKFKSWRHMSA